MPQKTLYSTETLFSGHVQGVGFRYQTAQLAKEFEVTGSVKNLPDGRVLLLAQGEKNEVEAFINSIKSEMSDYIKKCESNPISDAQPFKGFEITY